MYNNRIAYTYIKDANALSVFSMTELKDFDFNSNSAYTSGYRLSYTLITSFSDQGREYHPLISDITKLSLTTLAQANGGSIAKPPLLINKPLVRSFVGEGEWLLLWESLSPEELSNNYRVFEVIIPKDIPYLYIPGGDTAYGAVPLFSDIRTVSTSFLFLSEVFEFYRYVSTLADKLPVVDKAKSSISKFLSSPIPTIKPSSTHVTFINPGAL